MTPITTVNQNLKKKKSSWGFL